MGIRVTCPNCGRSLNVKSFLAGKRGVCPDCQAKFDIPGGSGERIEVEADASAETFSETQQPMETLRPLSAAATSRPLLAAMPPAAQPSAAAITAGVVVGDPIAEAPAAAWYVHAPGGGQVGPIGGDVLRQWLQQGSLAPDSLVWREGWADWRRADTLFAFPSTSSPAAAVPVAVPAAAVSVPALSVPAAETPLPAVVAANDEPVIPVIDDPLASRTARRTASRNPYKRRSNQGRMLALTLLLIVVLILVPALVWVLMNQ
jgi:hypothetical protein